MFPKKKKYTTYGRIGKRTDDGCDVFIRDNPKHVYVEFEGKGVVEWPRDRIAPNFRLIPAMPVRLNNETGILEWDDPNG